MTARFPQGEPEKGAVKKCINNTDITPPPVISTAAERSGEISLRNVASPWWQEISRLCVSLEPKIFAPYRQVPPLEMTMSADSTQSFQRDKLPKTMPRTPVISTVGAEWRNLTPKCGKPMVAGDLSALRFIRAQSPCPIPARSSARDDDAGGQHTVIHRGTN